MKARIIVLVVLAVLAAACADRTGEPPTPSDTTPPDTSTPGTTVPGATIPSSGEPAVLAASAGVERSAPSPDAPIAELAAGFNDAGFDLWRLQPLEDNLVFSPLSIGHALLMAGAAADDATASAIEAAFGLPARAHEAWNAADQAIASSAVTDDELTVRIADRIWPRLDVTPDQAWIDLLVAEHGATTQTLDFAGDPEGSRQIINSWVSDQTEGLIPELLPGGFIQGQTVLILTDAVYFKAPWQTIFGKYQNVTDTFTLLDGSTVETEYLRELELADLRGTGEGFVGAEVPYVGGEFSMLVLVPDEGRFEEVRERLAHGLLNEVDAGFTTGPFELLLPKWESTAQIDLLPWLTGLGAAPGAYPAIGPDAFLGGAVHGADIAVDEWGTVAAAATGLGFVTSGPPDPELTVAADRPFLYLIRHRPTGMVLFAGQVTDPTT